MSEILHVDCSVRALAVAGSFLTTLKRENVRFPTCDSVIEVCESLRAYIDGFYVNHHIQSQIHDAIPNEFERKKCDTTRLGDASSLPDVF